MSIALSARNLFTLLEVKLKSQLYFSTANTSITLLVAAGEQYPLIQLQHQLSQINWLTVKNVRGLMWTTC